MPRWLLAAAFALLLIAIASQFVIPPLAEKRIEDRLTDGGGSANVSLSAVPAARLLFGDGKRISISGNDLDLDLTQRTDVFERLDGFDQVSVSLRRFHAGPFEMASLDLTRPAPSAPYHLVSRSRTTPAELAAYGASRLGLPGGPLLGFFAGQAPGGNRPIPINLDMGMRSENGRVVVTSGGGTVAGYPAGPLAELITSTIAVSL